MGGDLTEAQKQLIEANRQQALSKRKQREESTEPAVAPAKPRGSRLTSSYYEYNLSTMRDTRGGYLAAEDGGSVAGALGRETRRLRMQGTADGAEQQQQKAESSACGECRAVGVDQAYLREYRVAVCAKCIGEMADKYSLLTKTEAKEDYLLTDSELGDRELFPVWEKANPHKSTWNNMLLFLRMHVEAFAVQKWGSLEALDEEFARRTDVKRARKEKKYQQSVAELRRRTRVEEAERGRRERLKLKPAHEHRFEPVVAGGEQADDAFTLRRCVECGLEEEYLDL